MIAAGRVLTGNIPDDLDEDDFQCYTASLSRFDRRGEELVGNWECVKNADTSFLKGGPERGWYVFSSSEFLICLVGMTANNFGF